MGFAALDHVPGDRLGSLYVVMLSTGLRPGEALGTTWSDVELCNQRATFRTWEEYDAAYADVRDELVQGERDSFAEAATTGLAEQRWQANQRHGRRNGY